MTGSVEVAKKKSARITGTRSGEAASRQKVVGVSDRELAQSDVKEPAVRQRWTFLTNHTHVLVLLDKDEPPVLREVAVQVGITERAVQRIIQDLEEGGFVERERVGRRNRYRVVRDIRLRHPIESHRTIGDLLNLVQSESQAEVSG
jgi:predicted ArsR family transcriptional regulator